MFTFHTQGLPRQRGGEAHDSCGGGEIIRTPKTLVAELTNSGSTDFGKGCGLLKINGLLLIE